jgi:SAM-dependent methyltransferase
VKKSVQQLIWDFIGAPLRMTVLPPHVSRRLGFTSLEDERLGIVLPHIKGKLLDIGAGRNMLVQRYPGEGIGVDVTDFGAGCLIVKDTARLPFENESFDTVTFLACLNHIPNRNEVMSEAWRIMRPDGILLVTMISPMLGAIGHRLWWHGDDRKRPIASGEQEGLWSTDVIAILQQANFRLLKHERFVYSLNNLFVGTKTSR